MKRLQLVRPEAATDRTKEMYMTIEKRLGVVPNMMQTMGNAPALLHGYLAFGDALGGGRLGAKLGELIALTVAEANQCDYCLSAHTYLGIHMIKSDPSVLEAARVAESTDPKTDAILKFARTLVQKRGRVSDDDLAALKSAQVSEPEISEVIGHVALNILTNYFNTVAQTEIDFPEVRSGMAVRA